MKRLGDVRLYRRRAAGILLVAVLDSTPSFALKDACRPRGPTMNASTQPGPCRLADHPYRHNSHRSSVERDLETLGILSPLQRDVKTSKVPVRVSAVRVVHTFEDSNSFGREVDQHRFDGVPRLHPCFPNREVRRP